MSMKSRTMPTGHTAGIFADMTLDGPEIGTLVAVVDRARNLPNRKTMGKQDPYCAMRLAKEARKTDTDRRGGQTPKWDQELRFTVHDSPDYYKLKCSVFNDDKKTDLIGEGWIDLREVVVPGGGQSDLWHQLNFKGKYAGEVRIELTYYDIRPKPESAEEKRKREKASSAANDPTAATSLPRQLGPREIKRRPLPPGPGGHSPSAPPITQLPETQAASLHRFQSPPGQWHDQPPAHEAPPQWLPQSEYVVPETPDDIGFYPPRSLPPDPSDPYPPINDVSRDQYYPPTTYQAGYRPMEYPNMEQQVQHQINPYIANNQPASPESPLTHHERPSRYGDLPAQSPSPASPLGLTGSPPSSSYHSSPPAHSSPPSTIGQQQSWHNRGSVSPTKHGVYRDSPLRQSISQQDLPQGPPGPPPPEFEDDAPPPPPAHRSSLSRRPVSPAIHQDSPALPRQRKSLQHVDDQSPLQHLEREYESITSSQRPVPWQGEEAGVQKSAQPDYYQLEMPDRRRSYADTATSAAEPTLPLHVVRSVEEQMNNDQRYANDQPKIQPRTPEFGPPQRAQTFDTADLYDERRTYRSDPAVVRPKAVSPNVLRKKNRKSISPQPPSPDQTPSHGVPYGPDSYDVLNPATGPAARDSSSYATAEEAAEAARQREVDQTRDQEPIIGNDGRIIDPSDHLPSDTWAPEPERKTRQPEHVIKIRTKDEARQSRIGSSPVSGRPHSGPATPYQGSPRSLPPESTSARNRLTPTRPLPMQPYPQPQSSPATTYTSPPQPHSQRNSVHSSTAAGLPQPPLASEYRVPAGNNYSPRGSVYHSDMPPTPTKAPLYDQRTVDIGYGQGQEDPLVAEMSMIDIGPSRTNRTTLRLSRGYGGY